MKNVAIYALATAIVVSGCAASRSPADRTTVTVALRTPVKSLNPLLAVGYDESYISVALFDGLVERNDAGATVPDLAVAVPSRANGGISPDGRTIVYRLHRNVRWHDGVPMTSSDVLFTYKLIRDPHLAVIHHRAFDDIAAIDAPDDYTVRVRLKRPYADAAEELFVNGESGAIVPAHVLARERDVRTAQFNAEPIGTGPYRLVRWDRGARLDFVANAGYFRGAPGIRHLTAVESTAANASIDIRAHRADIVILRPEDALRLREDRRISVEVAPSDSLYYLVFQIGRAPVNELRLRTALSRALDRTSIVRTVYRGMAIPAKALLRPDSSYYEPETADGGRYTPMRAAITLTYPSDSPDLQRVALLLRAQWLRAGVQTSLRGIPTREIWGPQSDLARGDFQVALIGQGFATTPDRSELITTSGLPPAGYNYARFSDSTVDALAARAVELNVPHERKNLYAKMYARLFDRLPYVPLFWGERAYGVDRRLRNFRPEPINSDLWNVWQWRWSPRR